MAVKIFTQEEKEKCNTPKGLFSVLNITIKPYNNKCAVIPKITKEKQHVCPGVVEQTVNKNS